MPKVTYVGSGGATRTVEAVDGLSVMEAALGHGVPGIDGDCGGACACATCHVYVEQAWLEKLPARSELERGMLDFAVDVKDNSRLACQIKMSPALDGLVVHTPERQY